MAAEDLLVLPVTVEDFHNIAGTAKDVLDFAVTLQNVNKFSAISGSGPKPNVFFQETFFFN